MNVLEAAGLGKWYRHQWALRDCSLAVPAGRVVALVGPNGAGKTTLLHMAVGLTKVSVGHLRVLGGLVPGTAEALAGMGFVAQDAPLYRSVSVTDMLCLARDLNQRWDARWAASRVARLGLPPRARVGTLSGGQQAQLALTIALAKRPRLLILDEPVARLDPLARHEFIGTLMAAVAEDGLSVIFSSHVVAELERIADYLIVLNRGSLQVAGDVSDLLDSHLVLTGPANQLPDLAGLTPLRVISAGSQVHVFARAATRPLQLPTGFQAHRVGLEDIVLAYLRDPAVGALPGPSGALAVPA